MSLNFEVCFVCFPDLTVLEAISFAVTALDKAATPEEDVTADGITKPVKKDIWSKRPLPLVIGTQEFLDDDFVGLLCDEDGMIASVFTVSSSLDYADFIDDLETPTGPSVNPAQPGPGSEEVAASEPTPEAESAPAPVAIGEPMKKGTGPPPPPPGGMKAPPKPPAAATPAKKDTYSLSSSEISSTTTEEASEEDIFGDDSKSKGAAKVHSID